MLTVQFVHKLSSGRLLRSGCLHLAIDPVGSVPCVACENSDAVILSFFQMTNRRWCTLFWNFESWHLMVMDERPGIDTYSNQADVARVWFGF